MEHISPTIHKVSQIITRKCVKYYHSLLSISMQFAKRGKILIELEKLKWELKKKYQALGKYVTLKKENSSVIDFSHDKEYMHKINEIIKLKFYITERLKTKETL